ncbi:MAG: hypothetical protein JWO87_127 [Phycisphaerales bacterium]|nr:hypothetical protein [Phycisphaerales bacterium]
MLVESSDMMMSLGTWRVKRAGTSVGLALVRISTPRYVAKSGPTYDALVRQITEYALGRPKLKGIRRYFFATESEMEILQRQLKSR